MLRLTHPFTHLAHLAIHVHLGYFQVWIFTNTAMNILVRASPPPLWAHTLILRGVGSCLEMELLGRGAGSAFRLRSCGPAAFRSVQIHTHPLPLHVLAGPWHGLFFISSCPTGMQWCLIVAVSVTNELEHHRNTLFCKGSVDSFCLYIRVIF